MKLVNIVLGMKTHTRVGNFTPGSETSALGAVKLVERNRPPANTAEGGTMLYFRKKLGKEIGVCCTRKQPVVAITYHYIGFQQKTPIFFAGNCDHNIFNLPFLE
jgi:hypothetical protein